MAHFVWSEKYSVGIQDIDNQHKHFFAIISELMSFIEERRPESALINSLKSLADYADYRFVLEEKYFVGKGFSGETEHVQAHNDFRDKIASFYKTRESESDPYVAAFELSDFAQKWLEDPILSMDQEFGKFFKQHPADTLMQS